jgi:GH35 family endo-1,4-beta-xylanase
MRWSGTRYLLVVLVVCGGLGAVCELFAQTSIGGNNLALRSTGSNQLASTGFVGTYLLVPDGGDGGSWVNLSVNATRGTGVGNPNLNVVVADSRFGFDVTDSGAQEYDTGEVWLPAGTHFVRVERDSPNNSPAITRSLTVNNLAVSGASFSNSNNTSNAINAANTYIDRFRKGSASVELLGATPGESVHVKLVNHEFNFGTAIGGSNLTGLNNFLNNANYRSRLLENFNMIVPGNIGKWGHSQPPNQINAMDAFLNFAEANGLRARMHNLIWDNQQPNNINTLINNALGGDAQAKANLSTAIANRIDYYVRDRAHRYVELDVLNEALRARNYFNIYGVDGLAEIYKQVVDAVSANPGADTGLYINDFNILQHNSNPLTGASDPYANWHRNHAEDLNNAGHGDLVSGIGIQYYVRHDGSVSVPRIQQVFQNMGVTGLPLTLSEFGVQTFGNPTPTQSANFLEETMRMVFGTPHATTFMMWGFWENDVWSGGPLAALYDANWNLTVPGERYLQLMAEWSTEEQLTVNPDGTIDFTGFYGDYEITIGDETFEISLVKGITDYSLAVAPFLPGDFNGDGVVDAADYTTWRDGLGGDFGPEGFDEWREGFGGVLGEGASLATRAAAVPEPTTFALLFVFVAFAGFRRRAVGTVPACPS